MEMTHTIRGTGRVVILAALAALLLTALDSSAARAGQLWGRAKRGAPGVRSVYLMDYQGPYDYRMDEVPRFRWGYFGTHTRPTSSWYRGYSRDFRQWTLQPGN